MLKELKQFGAKATDSFENLFNSSLVRLTIFYTLILAIISFISDTFTYQAFSSRIGHRFVNFPPPQQQIIIEVGRMPAAADIRADLIASLIIVDGLFLIVAALASYWLAKYTLKPIQNAYDKQRQFLSDASHELRSPLSIMHAELENELHKASPSQKEILQSSLEEVQRMNNIVNNLLTLSRLDENKITTAAKKNTLNLSDTICSVIKRFTNLANTKGVKIIFDSPTQAINLSIDEELFSHAFSNVIQNAINYNKPNGQVNISIEQQNKQTQIVVQDTGIGIQNADLKNIFERFYRVDKSRSRQTGGSGLGLSIAKSCITTLGGKIYAESEVDKGTKIFITLPN